MQVIITARHFELTATDKEYAQEKFSHVSRIHRLSLIETVFSKDNKSLHCEVKMKPEHGESLIINNTNENIRALIDLTVEKCERQLRKSKEKQEDKRYHKGE